MSPKPPPIPREFTIKLTGPQITEILLLIERTHDVQTTDQVKVLRTVWSRLVTAVTP